MEVIDNICEQLDAGLSVYEIYLDAQRAFDSVSLVSLLYKLDKYGISGVVNDWFKSYVSNRQ